MMPAELRPLANHLWQSSLAAVAAGLLAAALRRNRAAVRYGIWLAASVKFLLPLAWAASLAARLEWGSAQAMAQASLPSAVRAIQEPFAGPDASVWWAAGPEPAMRILPWLAAIWLCGAAASAWRWVREWRRMRAAKQAARDCGRVLRVGARRIPVQESAGVAEPCVFGILRPVLLLPEGLHERLPAEQWEAILLHEACHVRRRDNLAAAIHMAVETLFWFYPPVYWIGRRLMEEREIACDEEVVRATGAAQVYAQGIVEVCRFGVEAPPACAAGVGSSTLGKRIERIVEERAVLPLGWGRKTGLGAAGLAALAVPLLVGLAQSQGEGRAAFDVASVKDHDAPHTGSRDVRRTYGPRGVHLVLPLAAIISEAYNILPGRIVLPRELPNETLFGLHGEGYEIDATTEHEASKAELRRMLQSLLADRFRLAAHRENRTGPVYRLVVAKGGAKLEEAKGGGDLVMANGPDGFAFRNAEIYRLAGYLSSYLDRMAVDETGLGGLYNFTVTLPEELRRNPPAKTSGGTVEAPPASVFTEALKPLGLELIAGREPVEHLVVDHVERPSGN